MPSHHSASSVLVSLSKLDEIPCALRLSLERSASCETEHPKRKSVYNESDRSMLACITTVPFPPGHGLA